MVEDRLLRPALLARAPLVIAAALALAALPLAACKQAQVKSPERALTDFPQEGQIMFRKVDENMLASPQISVADVAAARQQGVTVIVNNRPDGEDPSAPQSSDIEAAAKAAGIHYIAIPITHAGFSRPQIDAMRAELDRIADTDGKMLAYCRSGTRSTLLWSLAQATKGESPRIIAAKAADAGYDIAPIDMMIDALAGEAKAQ